MNKLGQLFWNRLWHMIAVRYSVLVLTVLFARPLWALRCDDWVVEPEDSKQEVYDKCGEPDSFDSHWERRGTVRNAEFGNYGYSNTPYLYPPLPQSSFNYGQNNYQEEQVLVEEWIYDFGRRRLRQHLRFENGHLKAITDLGRGYRR